MEETQQPTEETMLCISETELQHLRSGAITHIDALLLNKLLSLSERTGWATVSAGALAQMLCCSQQTAHLSCNKLQKLGLVEAEHLAGIPVRKRYRRGSALQEPAQGDAPAGKVTLESLGATAECLQAIRAWVGANTKFMALAKADITRKKIEDISEEIASSGLVTVLETIALHKDMCSRVPADRRSLIPGWGYFDKTRDGRCTLWEPATGAWAKLVGTAAATVAVPPAEALEGIMLLARSQSGKSLAEVGDAARAAGAAGEKVAQACAALEERGSKLVGASVFKAMEVPFCWEGDYVTAWKDVLAQFSKEVF